MNEVWPAMYSAAALPSRWRAAVAKKRSWSTIGGISSERVSATGLPVFSTSRAISSSARASTASAMRNSASERSDGVVSRHVSNASAAARIAASTSSGRDRAASAYCSPVTGLTTGVVRPSAASTCLPLTKLENAFMERLYHDAGAVEVRRSTYDRAMTAAIRTVGVPKEIKTAEHRVAMTPDGVRELERHGIAGARRGRRR